MPLPGYTAEATLRRTTLRSGHRAVSRWLGALAGVGAEVVTAQSAATGLSAGRSRSLGFSCGDSSCVCIGVDDCIDMFNKNVCGPNAICHRVGSQEFCICGR